MDLGIVIILIVGLILIYAAVKGRDPRDIVKSALKKG